MILSQLIYVFIVVIHWSIMGCELEQKRKEEGGVGCT